MNDINKLFAPQEGDTKYTQDDKFIISLICRIDSYKFSHPFAYPDDIQIDGMTSYGETRVDSDNIIVPFGMQMLIKRILHKQSQWMM